jgi:acetyl-CoA carboxylase biotin carboxyl carrier protein
MDLRKLKTLIDLVSESDISELEITEAEGKVRIVKAGAQQVVYASAPTQISTSTGAPAAVSAPAEVAPSAPTGHTVKSPMVGTFYGASSPGAAPFVTVGSTVKKGQTLCIIEAMKLLNEIEADADGVITQALIENGQPVEFGQPLYIIG